LVAGCAFHPLSAEWDTLPSEDRETRAIETIRRALAERAARIPGHHGIVENEVLLVDRRVAVYRPYREQPREDPPRGNLAVLLLEDIIGLERRVLYDFPSHPEDLSIYLQRKSPSVWGVQAKEPFLSALFSQAKLGAPTLFFRQRSQKTYERLEAALQYLLSLPHPQDGVGVAVESILRLSVEEGRDRAAFEREVLDAVAEDRAE
jgi:hypothetical protein